MFPGVFSARMLARREKPGEAGPGVGGWGGIGGEEDVERDDRVSTVPFPLALSVPRCQSLSLPHCSVEKKGEKKNGPDGTHPPDRGRRTSKSPTPRPRV